MLQHERDQKQQLEDIVEQLARQHSHLEEAAHRHRPSKLYIYLRLTNNILMKTNLNFSPARSGEFNDVR